MHLATCFKTVWIITAMRATDSRLGKHLDGEVLASAMSVIARLS